MLLLSLGFLIQAASERPGSRLQAGMQLVYASDGTETAWSIDSVRRDTTFGNMPGCVRIRQRTSPTQAVPDTRAWCRDSLTLSAWDERTAQLRASRPITGNAVQEIPLAGGSTARYETGPVHTERISDIELNVVPTTVTTRDSTGRVLRRLRERFSIGLATATGGVFEVPDSTLRSGWKTVRAFELTAIRAP